MEPVTLYHLEPSFYSQIVRVVLAEKGIPWKSRTINIGPVLENYEPWYMRINPRGVVPTLDHNGTIVTDSFRIIHYIDEHFAEPSLHPEAPEERAKMEAWLKKLEDFPEREFSYSTEKKGLAGAFLKRLMAFSYTRRRSILRKHKEKNPDLADRYEARLRDIDTWQHTVQDPQQVKDMRAQKENLLDELEQALQGKTWLFGERYTLADAVWTVFLSRLVTFSFDGLFEDGKRPNVATYYQRLKQRPSFQKADIWERMKPAFMFHMLAPFALPRLLGALTVLTALSYGLWFLLQK